MEQYYINMHGMAREQAACNQCAPVLMTSVDTAPALCAEERRAIVQASARESGGRSVLTA